MGDVRASVVVSMVLLSLTVYLTPVCHGQGVLFSDVAAGGHINTVSVSGIQVAMLLRDRFLPLINALIHRLEVVEELLENELGLSHLPNLTAKMEDLLANTTSQLDRADAKVNNLSLTDKDDGQAAFFKGSLGYVNVKEAFVSNKFIAPMDGLYMINIRSRFYVSSGTQTKVMRNGNETLVDIEVPQYAYYSAPVRTAIRWLNKDEEIYTTGHPPNYFGVNLLRAQALMP